MAVNYGDKLRFSSVALDDYYHVKIPTFFVGVRNNGHLYFHSGNFWNTESKLMVKNTEWSLKSMNHSECSLQANCVRRLCHSLLRV